MNRTLCSSPALTALAVALCLPSSGIAQQESAPVEVTVSRPTHTEVSTHLESTGTFEASASAKIVARVDGVLEEVRFRDGAQVDAGELLFSIQRNTYEEQLKLYEAQLDRASGEYNRQLRLIAEDATSQARVETWRAKRDEAAANTRLAQINLGYTEVHAPFAGQLGRRLVDAGNLVGPNSGVTELVSLQRVDPIYLYFSINAPDALAIRRQLLTEGAAPGSQIGKTPVQVALGNDKDYRYVGRLDYVAPGIDESSGTIQLRAILENPDKLFVPGLFARIRVDFGQPVSRLMVPNRAVERDQAGPYVLVVDADDTVRRKRVQTGEQEGTMRIVTGGIDKNDRIIVKGLAYARAGQKVKVTEEKR